MPPWIWDLAQHSPEKVWTRMGEEMRPEERDEMFRHIPGNIQIRIWGFEKDDENSRKMWSLIPRGERIAGARNRWDFYLATSCQKWLSYSERQELDAIKRGEVEAEAESDARRSEQRMFDEEMRDVPPRDHD